MTMSKKGSRLLAVGDMSFRYRVRDISGTEVSLAVEASEDPGTVLSVRVAFRDPYLHPKAGRPRDQPLTPDRVRSAIQDALQLGWNPGKAGPPFLARLAQDGSLSCSV